MLEEFSIKNDYVEEETPFEQDMWKRGPIFVKYIVCESLKHLICKLGMNNNDAKEYKLKLRKHILHQEFY